MYKKTEKNEKKSKLANASKLENIIKTRTLTTMVALTTITAMLCGCAKSSDNIDTNVDATVSIQDIYDANTVEALLDKHSIVFYDTTIYTADSETDGYMGYDHVVIRKGDNGCTYMFSGANQSAPFTTVIAKENDTYVIKTQAGGEPYESREYEDETLALEEASQYLSRKLMLGEQTITDVSTQDGALVVSTISDYSTSYYWVDPETYELLGINEIYDTEAFGEVHYDTKIGYDTEPDFTIEIYEIEE